MTTKRRASSAKPRTSAARTGTGRSTGRTTSRTTSRSKTTRRSSTTRRTGAARAPRRRTTTATTLGAGVGTLVVAFLLGAPWSVKIALVVILLAAGVAYLIWSRRS